MITSENKDCRELSAKERVQVELKELNEKIVKLSMFLYSEKAITADISFEMRNEMKDQLDNMARYAMNLQHRLAIWGKTDKELREECRVY